MNPKPFQRRIAIVLLAIFLPSLLPVNLLYASNNGPNSFEAASFEPVDATDMVNLVTGDLSYVMPLLNIPSPEGGYPLALSYKAGIAMDQEASWVGLGWSLNPGAINRFVNGYADDVINGDVHNFAYDSGGFLNYYNIGIGGNYKGITLGVGAYWGSNKTFGGSVMFGVGPAVASVGHGTLGTNASVGYSNSIENTVNNISNGVTFESFRSQSGSGTGISNQGSGSFNFSSSYSMNDYDINSNSKGFNSGIGVYYGHTKVSYELYKLSTSRFSGFLYPINYESYGLSVNFDTEQLIMFNKNIESIINVNDFSKSFDYESVLIPSFDKYFVNSQGLTGSFTPVLNEEAHLKHENISNCPSPKNIFYNRYKGNYNDLSLKLNEKIFFDFNNSNSSFLRINRSNIFRDINDEINDSNLYTDEYKMLIHSKTNNSNLYNENFTNEGINLKNGNRKRTGKYIESFTNLQIRSDLIFHNIGFIEAKNLNRNAQTYQHESIGGFRITDVDGKTYHYSLPVINYETYYKNFEKPNDEHDKFYETENIKPYATDWLLTAVTGPDYFDVNGNGILDEEDYGYWVEFDYGKWSDGYMWQTSSGNYDIIKGDIKNGDRYEYHRGRKQIYYLDAIRTRTHTAYFVKSIRKDAVGKELKNYNSIYTPNSSIVNHTKKYVTSENYYYQGNSCSLGPDFDFQSYNIPTIVGGYESYVKGKKERHIYEDFPKHYSLKLDKIILVKNSSGLNINKASGANLTNNTKAYLYKNFAFRVTHMFNVNFDSMKDGTSNYNGLYLYNNNSQLKSIDIHISSNVIDVNDLQGLDVNSKAIKIINFEYDNNYTLMPNSNNSIATNKGKLTLNSVDFLGKNAVRYSPKYKFKYNQPSLVFNENNEDGWGYHKSVPAAWSLNEIALPTGEKLKFSYESDDYSSVASHSSRLFSKGLRFLITKNSTTNILNFVVTRNSSSSDNNIEEFNNFLDYFVEGEKISLDFFVCRRSYYGGKKREAKLNINGKLGSITNVTSNSVTFQISNNLANWDFRNQGDGWILNRIFSLTDVKHSNGSGDGVIMRNAGINDCPNWRNISWPEEYDNDDINFHYKLASSKTPNHGKNGGVRVSNISTYEGNVLNTSQNYFYNLPNYSNYPFDLNYKSSGVTSFVPYKHPVVLPFASELPSPIVMYKNVTVENRGRNGEVISKTQYDFEALEDFSQNDDYIYTLGDKLSIEQTQNYLAHPKVKFSKYVIKNKFSQLGRLKSIKYFNNSNMLLYSKKNNYKNDLEMHGELGVREESYTSRHHLIGSIKPQAHFVNSTSRVYYPNKLESTESTAGGYTAKTFFEKHDFLTGEVLETKTVTSDGKVVKSKIVPAYTKLPYQQMGSKVDNINNRNMLSQTAATYSYIQDTGDWKVTGVGITTWNNIWNYQDISGNISTPTADKEKIWRKHKSYTWNGVKDNNGIFLNYNDTNDDEFNWTVGVGSQPAHWKQVSEVTLYNHFSMPLEVKDINGNKAAIKMDVLNQKVEASGNAAYNEMYYSGAEEMLHSLVGQEVRIVSANRVNSSAHTGKFSIAATSSSEFGVYMRNGHRAGKYKLSVWVHKDNVSKARVRGTQYGTPTEFNGETQFAGDWVLKTHYFDVVTGDFYPYVTSADNTTVYFDDLMIRPIASSITGYVYNAYDELTHIIGNNGLATRFEYDATGRLVKTYVEIVDDPANNVIGGFKLKSQTNYNFKNL